MSLPESVYANTEGSCYHFTRAWTLIEKQAVISVLNEYPIEDCLPPEDEAELSDSDLEPHEIAELLKFSFEKEDQYYLYFGATTLVESKDLETFLVQLGEYLNKQIDIVTDTDSSTDEPEIEFSVL